MSSALRIDIAMIDEQGERHAHVLQEIPSGDGICVLIKENGKPDEVLWLGEQFDNSRVTRRWRKQNSGSTKVSHRTVHADLLKESSFRL